MRIKFKENCVPLSWDLNWKYNTSYLAKQVSEKKIEVYYPGDATVTIVPIDWVEIVNDRKGF